MVAIYEVISECYRQIENGVTKPWIGKLENGKFIIFKYPNNCQGNLVLLNEWISSNIAWNIALNIPEFGACVLGNDLAIKYLEEDNSGLCFYSEFIPNSKTITTSDYFKNYIQDESEFIDLLLFDHIIYNKDRNRGNLLLTDSKDEKRVLVFDHSHVFKNQTIWDKNTFMFGISDEDFKDNVVLEANCNTYELYADSIRVKREALNESATRMKKLLTKSCIKGIFDTVPNEFICDREDFTALQEYICYRIEHIDDFCDLIYDYYKGV